MKKTLPIYFFIATVILLSWIFRSNRETTTPIELDPALGKKVATKIIAVQVPEQAFFSGESVPVDVFDVKERLDRELLVNTYWHSNTLQLFKLAFRWFPTIEHILKEEGVPDDFKYLALIESGLRNVVSGRNAVGTWQFLSATGKEYGLEVNKVVDERYNVEKSTYAACKYLKKAHKDLKNWTLAAASYNMGRPRLKRLLAEQQVSSYYNLYLNDETSRYLFRIIAVKEIFNNPEMYGFYLNDKDLYKEIEFEIIKVDYEIDDLPGFAKDNGTNYKTLKLMNPWLRQPYLRNKSKKKYEIKLPC